MNSTSSPSNAANELRHKGDTWNVSRVYDDPVTGRKVRQVTAAADGEFNIHPSFDSLAFTADGEYFIFSTAHGSIAKGGRSALFKCCTATGDITQLTDASDDFLSWLSWALGGIRKGQGIYAQTACIAPKSRWAVYFKGPGMRKVHLDTLAEQVLLPDIGQWAGNTISVDPSETFALVPLLPMHPDVVLGRKPAEPWFRGADTVYAAAGGMRTRLLQVPMHGGDSKILFEYQGISSQHNPICPTDSDLALVTRDLPPDFPWMGDGGKVNRY